MYLYNCLIHKINRKTELFGYILTEVASVGEAWERGASGPSFDLSLPRNVTALKDANAYLHCVVHNLANKTVSIQ